MARKTRTIPEGRTLLMDERTGCLYVRVDKAAAQQDTSMFPSELVEVTKYPDFLRNERTGQVVPCMSLNTVLHNQGMFQSVPDPSENPDAGIEAPKKQQDKPEPRRQVNVVKKNVDPVQRTPAQGAKPKAGDDKAPKDDSNAKLFEAIERAKTVSDVVKLVKEAWDFDLTEQTLDMKLADAKAHAVKTIKEQGV